MNSNILYIHGESAIGGAETDLLSIVKSIDRTKFNPIVVCPGGPLYEYLTGLNVKTFMFKLPSWRKGKSILFLPWAVYKLRKTILRENINLIHVNDFWYFPVVYLASRNLEVPCITHIRQEIEVEKIKKYWLHYSDMLIPMSDHIKTSAIRTEIPEKKIKVVYTGLHLDDIPFTGSSDVKEKLGIAGHEPVIGTVANIYPRKGYEYLIEAIANIKKEIKDLRCIIVGEGDREYKLKLDRLANKLGVSENIIYVGFQRNVYPFIAIFDIFVLPSILEGFGIALIEAMAMGKPVVASNTGGIPEVVEDGVTGILVPPKNPDALADAILGLLNDKIKMKAMGIAGKERVNKFFTLKRMISQIENCYDELLNKKYQ